MASVVVAVAAGDRCAGLMYLTMFHWDGNALVAGKFSGGAAVECLEGEGMVQRAVGQPCSVSKGSGVVEADFILKVLDMIGRQSSGGVDSSEAKDTVDGASVAINIGELAKAILRDVILCDGKGVVEEAKGRSS